MAKKSVRKLVNQMEWASVARPAFEVSPKPDIPPSEPVTTEAVMSALECRAIHHELRDKKFVIRYEKMLALHKRKVDRSAKLIPLLQSATYKVKVAALLDAAAQHGVTQIRSVKARGGWLQMSGMFNNKAVTCHIWADLRGPVLDVNPLRTGRAKPMLRLKYYSKLYVENRVLDDMVAPVSNGIDLPF